MGNPFVHVELNTTDLEKAKTFYGQLFDWSLDEMPMPEGSYILINVGDGTGGGMMRHPVAGAPSMWCPYVLVDDLEARATRVAALGGTLLKPPTEVPGMGRFAIVMDPTGAVIGLWEPKKA